MSPAPHPTLKIPRRPLVMALASTVAVLSIIHLATQWMRYHTGITGIFGLTDLFAMQREGNLPTFFASFQMLLAAALLGWTSVIARDRGDRFSVHWSGLSAVFLMLAIDEASSIHELTIIPLHDLLDGTASGLLYWPWVLPGMAFVIFLAIVCFRWFGALDPQTQRVFAVSAVLFLGGAVGIEMAEASHVELNGTDNFGYAFFVWFEETLELAGVLVFLHGLLGHLERLDGGIHLRIAGNVE